MADAKKSASRATAAKKTAAKSVSKAPAAKAVSKAPAAKPATAAKRPATATKKPAAAKSARAYENEPAVETRNAPSALTGLMSSVLSNNSLSSVSGKAGVDSGDVAGILAAALPSLLNGANNQASTAATSDSFFEAVNQHAAKDPEDVDVDEGHKIVSHLLGDDAEEIERQISKKTGISSAKVGLVLAAAAPIIMNLLGKETSHSHSSSSTASLLGSLLGGSSNSSSSNSLMSAALGSVLTGAMGGNSGSNSILGSLLGGSGSASPASSMLGSILGATTGHSSSNSMAGGAMGLLGSLLGNDEPSYGHHQQQQQSSGVLGILSNLLK